MSSNKVKNIIVVYDYAFINGGAAKVAIQSAIELSELYKDCKVYYYSAVGGVCDELNNSSVNVICLNEKDINSGNRIIAAFKGIWNNKAKNSFQDFLSEFSPKDTIVHIHGWVKALSSAVIKVSTKKGFKTIITLHDYFSLCPNGGFYNYKTNKICQYDAMSLKCIFCSCDKRNYLQKLWRVCRQFVQDRYVRYNNQLIFFSISEMCESVVKQNVTSDVFFRVQNPYDLGDRSTVNAEFNKNYLFVGRVSEEKGIDIFCEAFTKLLESKMIFGDVIVIGAGPLLASLQEKYERIKFVGWKNRFEIEEYIKDTRCLVFPSRWYEGAPLTPIEFMSHGIPCIISDCCAATEYIEDSTGLTFSTGNVENLMDKIIYANNYDNWKVISLNLREKFNHENFEIKQHIKCLYEIYNQIIG